VEHSVEELSQVKKKVAITAAPQEVEAAIMATIALYRDTVHMDGFRKGKAPSSLIEKRFRQKIYEEARQDIVNAHINEIMRALDATPVSEIKTDGDGEFARGNAYSYTLEFETLPDFDLPVYEGLEVEQEKVILDKDATGAMLDRIRLQHAKLVPIDGVGPGVDGQIVNLDFAAYENGAPLEHLNAENFDLELGARQAFEDFEKLVKTIPYGQEGEGEISFPEDFLVKDLAGKTVTMKVSVHAIKERQLPDIDDNFLKKLKFESIDELYEALNKSYMSSRASLHKSAAQNTLLTRLLKDLEFALPESMVETQLNMLLAREKDRLERLGRSLEASSGRSLEELRGDLRPQAEEIVRTRVLLLRIAKKEELVVSDQELRQQIFQASRNSGEDFETLLDRYQRSGMIFTLRDHLLADKAMDAVYDKARVTEVDPAPIRNESGKNGENRPS